MWRAARALRRWPSSPNKTRRVKEPASLGRFRPLAESRNPRIPGKIRHFSQADGLDCGPRSDMSKLASAVRAEQVRTLYRQSVWVFIANPVNALITALCLWQRAHHGA